MVNVKARYPHASVLDAERVVFNIGGNNARLVVTFYVPAQAIYIKFVGTHAQYDRIDVSAL
jgi:mRNA interferase HigB